MIVDKTILLTDRTTIETDWLCGAKRWWYKEEGGDGIVPVKEAIYYEVGRDIHSDMERLLNGESINEIIRFEGINLHAEITDQLVLERIFRRMGWAVAFATYILPTLIEKYDVISLEKELILDRTPLWIACTPDVLLRRKSDGRLIYRDYKSVKMLGKSWMDHWPYAIQMHIGLKAIEEELGEVPAYAEVMGLRKGEDRKGKLMHPYVWAYWDEKKDLWQHDYKYGLVLRPVWEYPGGIEEWVKFLGRDVAIGQFPLSKPIFLDERLLNRTITERILREQEVREVKYTAQLDPNFRALYFRQNFSECLPSFGDPCPYLACCHNASVELNPLASGDFIKRTPHHEVEVING